MFQADICTPYLNIVDLQVVGNSQLIDCLVKLLAPKAPREDPII
jgi:hypothetical protein